MGKLRIEKSLPGHAPHVGENELLLDRSTGKLHYRNGAGAVTEVPSGDGLVGYEAFVQMEDSGTLIEHEVFRDDFGDIVLTYNGTSDRLEVTSATYSMNVINTLVVISRFDEFGDKIEVGSLVGGGLSLKHDPVLNGMTFTLELKHKPS